MIKKKITKEIRARVGEGRKSANDGFNCPQTLHTHRHTPNAFPAWISFHLSHSHHQRECPFWILGHIRPPPAGFVSSQENILFFIVMRFGALPHYCLNYFTVNRMCLWHLPKEDLHFPIHCQLHFSPLHTYPPPHPLTSPLTQNDRHWYQV